MRIFFKGITHNGVFHADDVFSTALLKMVNPLFSVKRVSDILDVSDSCIVYDIGGGKYDHHSDNVRFHDNGKRYASFGLLWDEYGKYVSGSGATAKRIEEKLVSVIDESDNGGEYDTISKTISAFNPVWNSDEDSEKAFEEAVHFAELVLFKIIKYERSVEESEIEIEKALNKMKDGIVVFSHFLPFSDKIIKSDAVYAIYPSKRGGFCIQGIPVSYESRKVKKTFPEEWHGVSSENLKRISGFDKLNFCHNSGFLAVADDYDSALKIAEYSLKKQY